jgi:dipeptidyl aminopeptidase/acylaminoacyl peptidase
MAQYFANRGYLVLQPNFRGSDGYGKNFQEAGYGEWGGKMQDDVTDGVLTLIQSGTVDPQRICIVGGSYGGYAALAGGAYTPGLYKCVVAIAPVSDLPLMIKDEAEFLQKNHWILAYLKEAIGDIQRDRSRLEAISPVNAADQFLAPVLLIHGDDDTVVPFEQSEVMAKALKDNGKSVTFVKLKSEDHWLSHGDSRKAALRAASQFVDENIGAD